MNGINDNFTHPRTRTFIHHQIYKCS